jgi:hypothetical protein
MASFFFNDERGKLLTDPDLYDGIAIFQNHDTLHKCVKIAFFTGTNMTEIKSHLDLIKLHMGVKLKNLAYIAKFIKGLKIDSINPLAQNYQFALIKAYNAKPNHLTLLYLPPTNTFENNPLLKENEKVKLFKWASDYLYAYPELNQIKPLWRYEKLAKTEILHIKRIDSIDSITDSILDCKSDLDRFNADLRTKEEILTDAIEHFFPHDVLLKHPDNKTLDIIFIPTHKGIFLIGTTHNEITWIKESAYCSDILSPDLYNCIGKWENFDRLPPKQTYDPYFHQLLEYLIFCIRENIEDCKGNDLAQNPDIANDVLSIYHKGESLFKLICSMK